MCARLAHDMRCGHGVPRLRSRVVFSGLPVLAMYTAVGTVRGLWYVRPVHAETTRPS